MATNSTVIHDGTDALLVDPAWLPDELEGLAAGLDERALHVVGGVATHPHHDHLLWHPRFGEVPRWASIRTAAFAGTEREALLAQLGDDVPPELADLMGRVTGTEQLPGGARPGGTEIELIVHDGHAPGHSALWLPEQRVLIAGDMLSDTELPLPFFPDDLAAYLDGLDALAPLAARAAVVIPGHGTVGEDAMTRLDADRRYIDEMIRRGDSDDPRARTPAMRAEHAHMAELARALRG